MYKFTKANNSLLLKSEKYHIIVSENKNHIHITMKGPGFKKQGLTSIKSFVNSFEKKVIALHFYRQARQFGKNGPTLDFVNYADIFGSCFD